MRLNPRPRELFVGQRVTTDFYKAESGVVRTITVIEPASAFADGLAASVDGGDVCPHCQKPPGCYIYRIAAAWLIPVGSEEATCVTH